jgi:lipopolysaccharide export system protein LptA
MKAALLIVVVLGFAVVAGGQTASAPSLKIFAADASSTGELRGNVELSLGDATVTADEIDLQRAPASGTTTLQLRGNVQITMSDANRTVFVVRRR